VVKEQFFESSVRRDSNILISHVGSQRERDQLGVDSIIPVVRL
jgi:hypothetical protein